MAMNVLVETSARHIHLTDEAVKALYGEGGFWVRPAAMWFEHVVRDGYSGPRFVRIDD